MSVIQTISSILTEQPSLTLNYDPAIASSQEGSCVSLDQSSLHPNVLRYLQNEFPSGLYAHQHAAVEHVLGGQHTVVATRTSSGKSLIYSLPMFDALARDPDSTALFLFPQKALANDQQLKLRTMAEGIDGVDQLMVKNTVLISRYDGSTPGNQRQHIRDHSQIILTNPDMLHMGIMQYHQTNWSRFFSNLKVVAIDECHEYRGVFGTNVSFILRRLRQICRMHGSEPRFVATSATVQSPEEHMHHLTGQDFVCVGPDSDSSRQGPRKFWMVQGDEHFYDTGRKLAKSLADAGLTVLVFCPSRISAEKMVAKTVKPEDLDDSEVRVYRSGLSSEQREEIERGLRDRSVRLVFSTSALELGIDIGEIDVVLCVGLPHTMMSFWQRSGRAARGGREGATILIPADTPIDSYYANHPEELFARENEPLVLNLQNKRIAGLHYACAAQEFGDDENAMDSHTLGAELGKIQELRAEGKLNDDIFYCSDPHIEVNIRSGGERSFKLLVDDEEIGEISHYHLLRECYPHAVYRHGGRSFRVQNIIYGKKLIRLKREFSRNETSAHTHRKIRLKNQFRLADYQALRVATVSLDVTEYLVSVSEKNPSGETVMTWPGASGMRQYRLPTEGTMLAFSKQFWSEIHEILDNTPAALSSVERLLASLFPTISGPCDTQDYASGIDQIGNDERALFLYDTVYDGVDLTTTAFDHIPELLEKSIERVTSCDCQTDEGCFRCIANPFAEEATSKTATLMLLNRMLEVIRTTTPSLREFERDFDMELQEDNHQVCPECGHQLPMDAKFCSECGTKMEG